MDRYQARGASARKEDVHAAIRGSDPGLFPKAFCKLVPDVLGGDPDWCLAMHADGAGTKSALAYLMYRETGDLSVFAGIAQDALVMNVDDLLCVGATGPFLLSNAIARNARRVRGEVIAEIIHAYDALAEQFRAWGVEIVPTGGETADVGDLVGTLMVDATLTVRLPRRDVVPNDRVRPGDVIVGLSSSGQATYESRYNAGIGSNGLTSARHDLLHVEYAAKYPETFDPDQLQELRYSGPFRVGDPLEGTGVTIGQALLSPTRTYAPILVPLLKQHRARISALVHCTGGGQTKCLHAGEGIHYVKDRPFAVPPLFNAIRRVTNTPWRQLYQVFNMGHRLEIVGPEDLAAAVIMLAGNVGVEAKVVGHCEASTLGKRNLVSVTTPGGVERYEEA